MKKRILSIFMVLSMCLSMLPTAAFAAEDTGLCKHHSEHTEECGYAEAVAGEDCTHIHTADCYTNGVLPDGDADSASAYELEGDTEQLNTLFCTHTHDEDCYVTDCVHAHDEECGHTEAIPCGHEHNAECGYAAPVEETPCGHIEHTDCGYAEAADCTHTHDSACGYAESVGGQPCGNTETDPACDHSEDCGYVAPVAEVPCAHTHDGDCGYAEAADCTHAHDVDCGYAAPVEGTPCNHTAHDETCGYVEGAPCAHYCTEDTGCVTLSYAHVCGEDCTTAGELACQHTHDDACGYVETVEASPCTYECELCALTEITAWSWIDEWEIIDPDTGVVALPGASEDTPAYFDDIVSMLPVEITATVEDGEETVALDGWACSGYPEEGAYSGNYIFTAALPEGYVLGLGTPELAVTVELGGAAVYADVTLNGLTISGGTEGTDFAFNQEVLMEDGTMSSYNSSNTQGIKILSPTELTISGTLAAGGDYTGIYIPENVEANLTLDGASIGGGNHTCPITVEGTLNLTLIGKNDIVPHTTTSDGVQSTSAGIWVLKDGNLVIDGDGSLDITTDIGNAAIGQTSYATSSAFGDGSKYSGANAAGSITINGGTLNITANGTAGGASSAIPGGAAIGAAGGNGKFTNITINGGVINATSASGAAIGTGATQYTSSGRIVINGGTINATGGNYGWAGSSLVADGIGGTQTLTGTVNNEQSGVFINGGSVKTNRVENNRPTDGTNGLYLVTITLEGASSGTAVTSATYYDANGASQTYAVSGQTDTSGNIYLCLPVGAIVTKVTTGSSTNYYGSLLVTDDDLGAATFTSGTEVTLTVDTSITNAAVTFSNDSNTITASEDSMVFVKVEPIGSYAVDGVGTSSSPTTYTHVTDNLYSVTMPSGGGTLYVSMAEVTVPEVLDLAKGQITFGYDSTNLRTVTYTDDNGVQTKTKIPASITYTIIQSDSGTDTTDNTITISNWKSGGQPLQLTIENLYIQVSTDVNAIDINNSNVELTLSGNSTITSSVSSQFQALVGVDGNSTLTFTEESGEASLSVNGAATCYNRGAAIGGDGNNGTEIPCGTINIKGGKIIANTNNAGAAIGSGLFGTGGIVNISGGTVEVTTAHNGAAIGSGQRGSATVIISDGTVEATTTKDGAAIGSGTNGSADVTITGGDIIATGSSDAPAIGSGYGSSTATVTITGGNINIEKNAATIGKSADAAATVTITGGSVNGTITSGVTATNNGGTPVYKITAALPDKDATVTGSITDGTYNFNGVKTNSEGKIFLWLPESSESDPTKATFNGGSYIGTVKTDNTGEFVSDKPSPTVTAPTANSRTYDGTEQVLVTAGSTTGGTLQYALGTDSTTIPGDENWSTTIPAGTDAKTYYVWYKVVGNDEYADVAATCVTVTIAQRTITVKADDQTVLVGGSITAGTNQVAVSDLANGHSLSEITLTGSDTSSTTTSGTITPSDAKIVDSESNDVTANYSITYANGVLTVATHTHDWSYTVADNIITATCSSTFGSCPADNKTVTITLTAPTGDALIYNGNPIGATATSSNSTELAAPTEINYSGNLTDGKPVNAGTYTASIEVGGKTAQVTYIIAAKTIADATITLSATSGDYNGSTQQPTVSSVELNGSTLAADNYTVSYLRNGTATTDFTSAGMITVVVEGKGNYTGKVEKSYTINPIAPTAANFSFTLPTNLTYSGTAKAAVVTPATGATGMGAVTVKYSADPVNVGEYTVSIDVAAGDNYTATTGLTADAWKFSITKAPLTITADDKSMLTGKELPTLTCSYSGFVNGETESVLTTQPTVTTTANGQTAGSFDITVSGATAANYEISYVKGTLTVSDHVHAWTYTADDTANTITASCNEAGCPTPTQTITLTAPAGTLVYDGTAKEATVSGSIDGVTTPTVSYTGSLTDGKPINAGSYTASITVGGKSVSVDIVIGNASQTVPSVSAKNETIKGAADGGITGATEDMEYSTTSGGTYTAIPEKLAAGTYYVRYKAKTNYDPSPDTTVTIAAGPAIAVTFNVDGGSPAPEAQSLSYKGKVTKPADPTKEDYEFLGWYNGDTAYDFNTEVTVASLALTAKWKQVAFTVGVNIMDGNTGMEGISVKLMKGSEVLHSGTTDSSGHIDFSHISAGAYNIVAVFGSGDAEQTRTALVTLTGDSTQTINKPLEGANSHLEVSADSDTPAVVVGGLDHEAEELKTAGVEEVSVNMSVEGQKKSEVETTVVTKIDEVLNTIKESVEALVNSVVEYLDVTMEKTVVTTSGSETDPVTTTTTLIELVVPFPGGRGNPVVIRHHGDSAAQLTKITDAANKADGTFLVDEDSETLHIYTQNFSTYAIAYTTAYTITFDPNEGILSGDSSATTTSDGKLASLPTPTRSGYTFKGWYTAPSGGTKVTGTYVFSNDATIYAQWTKNSVNPGGGGGGYVPSTPAPSVKVPISGDDTTIQVSATVSRNKATIQSVDLAALNTVIGNHVDTGVVTIDFSVLDKEITSVEIPANVVKQIERAVNDPANDAESLEIILSDGTSIEFDAAALGEKAAQASGQDITISIKHAKDARPNASQQAAINGRPAYDITVTSGDKHISDMGGKITVHVPYELQNGEHPRGIVVWYVDEDGNREHCETSYDNAKKRVNWKTDHLSLYMIDYDPALAEICDGGEGCPSAKFIDIDPNAWYHEAIDYAIEQSLMNGYGNGHFGPNDNLSRGMLAQILYNLEGRPAVSGEMPFTDVADGKYYVDAIKWAQQNGIVGGYGGSLFGPDDPITREQLAVMLWRYAGSPAATNKELNFNDADEAGSWALDALIWAQENGVMQGNNGEVSPKGNATRAHVAQMLMRFIENILK